MYQFVIDVPQIPHSLSSENVSSRSLVLLWAIPHDNNAPILGYSITYRNPFFIESGKEIMLTLDENIGELKVKDLHPGIYYNFSVIAFNEEGQSAQSEIYIVRTLEEGM